MAAHGIEIWEKIIGFGAWAAASLKAKTDGCLCWGVLNKLGSPGSGRMYLPKKRRSHGWPHSFASETLIFFRAKQNLAQVNCILQLPKSKQL